MSTRISRRGLFLWTAAPENAPASAGVPGLTAADRAVEVVSGSDKGFAAALQERYPGLQNDPVFQIIAPLALLVSHAKGPAIRAFSIAWRMTTAAGSFETALFSYLSPGPASKGRLSTTLRSARIPVLRAGQTVLVTPYFVWSTAYYQRHPQPDWSKVLTSAEPGGFLVSELPNAISTDVWLDGVVFADWKLMGPNRHRLAARLRARRHAEQDEGLVAYRLLKAGASDSVITDTLASHASAARSSHKKRRRYWYEQARRYQAQVLLRAFASVDKNQFQSALHRLVSQKRTVITRVPVV
jgi:hypothetical protein